MRNRALLTGLIVLGLAFLGRAVAAAEGPIYIPLIAKGFREEFWQAVMKGAQKAARDFNVVVTFEGPEHEPLVDTQVDLVRTALEKHPAALGIAALDSEALIPLLQKAQAAKIPVIGFDSGVDSPIPVATAATDNIAAAALAADKMAALIGGAGKVGVIIRDATSRTCLDRTGGFLMAMKKWHPRIQVIGPRYGEGDLLKSAGAAKDMIQANPDIRGIFAGDDGSATGVVRALQDLDLAGKLVVIGYDSGKAQIDAIRSGVMTGAVTQDPIRLGYMTVEAAVRIIKGRRVSKTIDTGFHWYDRTNIDDPAIEAILFQ
jgi:ribose transport system substrate-binding protein